MLTIMLILAMRIGPVARPAVVMPRQEAPAQIVTLPFRAPRREF